jgi:transcriptional regulator GlxA family with amidase domain
MGQTDIIVGKTDMPAAPETLEIGLLLYPGAQLAAVYGLTDLFSVANRMAAERGAAKLPALRVTHWAQQEGLSGIQRVFDSRPGSAGSPRIIILPPCLEARPEAHVIQPFAVWLGQCHQAGVTLGSVCAGAFLLAETSLLDGRTVTTHWGLAQALRERFPNVQVDADRMIVDDGDIITAGGLMAWTDLGLALVERLLGPTIASETARYLVIDLTRLSQRYFSSFVPRLDHGDEPVLRVQRWLQSQSASAVPVAAMAAQAGMGERTFLRRFRAATGLKPTEYCQQLRVGKARELLELTNRGIEQVAWAVGYQDPGAFRKVFQQLVGLSPGDYRRRFGSGAQPLAPT